MWGTVIHFPLWAALERETVQSVCFIQHSGFGDPPMTPSVTHTHGQMDRQKGTGLATDS